MAKTVKKKAKTVKKTIKTPVKRVNRKVKKSLDSLKEDLYGIQASLDAENPEQRKIQLQTLVFELASIKQLLDRVSNQLKTVEEHLEEIKNQ